VEFLFRIDYAILAAPNLLNIVLSLNGITSIQYKNIQKVLNMKKIYQYHINKKNKVL